MERVESVGEVLVRSRRVWWGRHDLIVSEAEGRKEGFEDFLGFFELGGFSDSFFFLSFLIFNF